MEERDSYGGHQYVRLLDELAGALAHGALELVYLSEEAVDLRQHLAVQAIVNAHRLTIKCAPNSS